MSQITRDNLLKSLIDKMLEKHGKDYAWASEYPTNELIQWYEVHTWTEEEKAEFKKWAVPVIQKALKCTKDKALREYDWFNFLCGLKIENNDTV